jgi:hypothetical protein
MGGQPNAGRSEKRTESVVRLSHGGRDRVVWERIDPTNSLCLDALYGFVVVVPS